VLSGRNLCDELIARPEESYRLWCVVVFDLERSRICATYVYDISTLRVNHHNETILPVAVPDFLKDRGFFIFGSLAIRQNFEITGTAYPVTHRHATKEWIYQSQRRENLRYPFLPTFLKSTAPS
jgi:hypothetical protein